MSAVDGVSPRAAYNPWATQPIFGTQPKPQSPLVGDLLLDQMVRNRSPASVFLGLQGYTGRSHGPSIDGLTA